MHLTLVGSTELVRHHLFPCIWDQLGFDDEQIKQMLGIKTYGRCGIRTHDPFRVKEVRYHCANRPHYWILKHSL